MKAQNLFLLIVFTAFAILLWYNGSIPEVAAIAFLLSVALVIGWANFVQSISKW